MYTLNLGCAAATVSRLGQRGQRHELRSGVKPGHDSNIATPDDVLHGSLKEYMDLEERVGEVWFDM